MEINELFRLAERAKMRERHIMKRIKMKGKTNWNKVKSLTEEQIIAAAKSDPDSQPLTREQLKKFKRVNSPKKVNVKSVREKLHLSQREFADYFGVSVRTIQEWEQNRRIPSATARNFLKVIEIAPLVVQKALAA
jgi:putative transcriptional regulator